MCVEAGISWDNAKITKLTKFISTKVWKFEFNSQCLKQKIVDAKKWGGNQILVTYYHLLYPKRIVELDVT